MQGPNSNASDTGPATTSSNGHEPTAPDGQTDTKVAEPPQSGQQGNGQGGGQSNGQGGGKSGGMSPGTRRLVIVGSVVLLIALCVGGGMYWHYLSQFVTTDNAQVDGDKTDINAPAEGTIVSWDIDHGSQVSTNQVVGRIKLKSNGPQKVIKSPGHGVVAVTDVVDGTYVKAGQLLATAYDYNQIYVTARVDEDDVGDIHVGAPVDIDADAFPGSPITGIVENINNSSAALVEGQSQNNQNGNFQKVTQVIPIKVKLVDTRGNQVVPGMNVTVHIHKKVNS